MAVPREAPLRRAIFSLRGQAPLYGPLGVGRAHRSDDVARDTPAVAPLAAPRQIPPLLAFQRSAGNQATVRLLRQITTTADTLEGGVAGLASTFARQIGLTNDVFGLIRKALTDYHASRGTGDRFRRLGVIQALIYRWMEENASKADSEVETRRAKLVALGDEAAQERVELKRQGAQYLVDLEDSSAVARSGGDRSQTAFSMLSSDGWSAAQSAGRVATGQVTDVDGERQDAQDLVKQYMLNEAQIAAIRIYTGVDHRYINVAMDDDQSRMPAALTNSGNVPSDGRHSPAELQAGADEGRIHGGMLSGALSKLPNDPAPLVFRGMRMADENAVRTKFPLGQDFDELSFTSASKSRAMALSFSEQGLGTVRVLVEIHDQKGKDLSALSRYRKESEVLVPAGSRFHVNAIELLDDYFVVQLQQL